MEAIRNGNFTSSEIFALTTNDRSGKGFGKPALTYIQEKQMERRLGRSLTGETSARPTSWGKLNEKRVHNLLGLDYRLCSTETLGHPTISFWKGSPDFIRHFEDPSENTVVDAKCPLTLKSFCYLVDAWQSNGLKGLREVINGSQKVGEQYYWQLVSNAILTGCKYAELIVYAPYKSELEAIRDMAINWTGEDEHLYKWIAFALDEELPYLIEGGHYKNLNRMRFEVPDADKAYLTECVLKAGVLLGELLVPEVVEN